MLRKIRGRHQRIILTFSYTTSIGNEEMKQKRFSVRILAMTNKRSPITPYNKMKEFKKAMDFSSFS